MQMDLIQMVYYPNDSCAAQIESEIKDWLHGGNEVSIAFKVNYISEDLLLVMVASHYLTANCAEFLVPMNYIFTMRSIFLDFIQGSHRAYGTIYWIMYLSIA